MKKSFLSFLFFFPAFTLLSQAYNFDSSFGIGTGFSSGNVHMILPQSDGKLLVGGSFTSFNGQTFGRIVRLNVDGSLDSAFASNTGVGANNTIYGIALQADGKILLCGDFTEFNSILANRIIRLESNGSIDASFTIGIGADNRVNKAVLQSDGKIVIGGRFQNFNGTAINRLARLNTNGSLDVTFTNTGGAGSEVMNFYVYPDDKLLVCGNFININGTPTGRVARLNANGTVDLTFSTSANANATVNKVLVQDDGNILIGGFFTQVSGSPRGCIARLSSNGGLDAAFSSGTGADNGVQDILIAENDDIIVVGNFQNYAGVSANYIAVLDDLGAINPLAMGVVGTGFSWNTLCLTTQADGKILAGGLFSSYNGSSSNRIVRLAENTVNGLVDNELNSFLLFPNPASQFVILDGGDLVLTKVSIFDLTGKLIFQLATGTAIKEIDISELNQGTYILIAESSTEMKCYRLIKQ